MESKRGFVQISIEEYDQLKRRMRETDEFLQSDKCVRILVTYSPGNCTQEYIVNPPPDFKDLADRVEKDVNERKEKYWSLKRIHKRISVFDIGKRICDIIK